MRDGLADPKTISRLEIGLQRMPRLRRETFLAHRLYSMPYAEISARTGLSVKQVERHIAASMLTLMEAVDGRPPVPWWKRFFRRTTSKLRR